MRTFEEHARPLPTLVAQAMGGSEKVLIAAKTASQFQEVAKGLSLVTPRRVLCEAVEIQVAPLPPEHERQGTRDCRIPM